MSDTTKEPAGIDVDIVRAHLKMSAGETLAEFRQPAKLRGEPVPVFCCLNCSTLYEDEGGEKPIHDDGREALKECPCKAIELVDARTLKFDYEAPACAGCGAIFEAPDKATVLVAGVELKEPCQHENLIPVNARERGLAYWEDGGKLRKGAAPVPRHIVRAARLGEENA